MIKVANPNEFRKKFDKEIKTGLISLLVLLIIYSEKKPIYGYKIIKKMEELSNNSFKLPEGTIYPVLSSLLNQGLVTSYWGDAPEGPRRKYYKLTVEGKTAFEMGLNDWRMLVDVTEEILKKLGLKI